MKLNHDGHYHIFPRRVACLTIKTIVVGVPTIDGAVFNKTAVNPDTDHEFT